MPLEPDDPEVPLDPLVPVVPEVPATPDEPEVPLEPPVPVVPDEPEVPLVPDGAPDNETSHELYDPEPVLTSIITCKIPVDGKYEITDPSILLSKL